MSSTKAQRLVAEVMPEVPLREVEVELVGLRSAYLARLAAAVPEVQAFRRHVLEGRLLSVEEVDALYESGLTREFPPETFQAHHVPVASLEFETVTSNDMVEYVLRSGYRLPSVLNTVEELRPFNVRRSNGTERMLDVVPGSVLDELRQAAQIVAENVVWTESGAATFILTGQAPAMPAAQITLQRTSGRQWTEGRITIAVDPAVSAETVASTYRYAQQLLGSYGPQIEQRALALYAFVEERRADEGRRYPFTYLLPEWNSHAETIGRGEWTYRHASHLARAYNTARERVISPEYPLLGLPLAPQGQDRLTVQSPPTRVRHTLISSAMPERDIDLAQEMLRTAGQLLRHAAALQSSAEEPSIDLEID